MNKRTYFLLIFLVSLLLPIAAIAPYIFFGNGFRVLFWVFQEGYWLFWINLIFSIASAFVCAFFILQFHSAGRLLYLISSITITSVSAAFAMLEHRHILLVIIFLMASLLVWVSEWLRQILNLPYYNSQRHWWEAQPKKLPGIVAKVFGKGTEEKGIEARVVNFGESGCFIFLEQPIHPFHPKKIELAYQKLHLVADVEPVIYTNDKRGIGLKFECETRRDDWHKDLQDFLNSLRRSGYVAG